jgi:hypothetical protein
VRDIKMMKEMLQANGQGGTLTIEKFAVFDQFPYTDHLECGALISISNPTPRLPHQPQAVAGATATVPPGQAGDSHGTASAPVGASAAQKAAMLELVDFIKDETRTILAFAPDCLTADERNEVRKKAVLESGYKAKSKGGGANRQLVIVKPGHSGPVTAEARAAAQSNAAAHSKRSAMDGDGEEQGGATTTSGGATDEEVTAAKKQKLSE